MKPLIFIRNVIQLLLAPTNAWKDIEREEVPVEEIISRGLYPLMALMLLSVFIKPLYGFMDYDIILLLQVSLVQFVALFAALFAGRSAMDHFITRYNSTGQKDPIATGTVAAYSTGLMTLFQLIENLIPIELTVIQLMPALAAVCIWRSYKYLDITAKGEMPFMLITVASLIAPVIIINLTMTYLIY